MEVVGKLYGVTMQERGVSTMVSVSLQNSMQFAQA
jgi:chromosome segregation protein